MGTVYDYPKEGACNIVMDGANNRIEGFHVSTKGSYRITSYNVCYTKLLRIRTYEKLVLNNGNNIKIASSDNPNFFYQTPSIKRPLTASQTTVEPFETKPYFEYDIPTEKGQEIKLSTLK